MARYRFLLKCSVAIVLASSIVETGRAQIAVQPERLYTGSLPGATEAVPTAGPTCKVYSLAELGDDPNLCKWIAETIPQMIKPGSWTGSEGKLSYYAPGKVMVINHTAAVHGQIDEFLQNLKKSLPQAKVARPAPLVLPAQFTAPDRQLVPPSPLGYPVPTANAMPKHLFHFIIRYEGDGIIDANVVEFMKAQSAGSSSYANSPVPAPPPPPPTPTPTYIVPTGGSPYPSSPSSWSSIAPVPPMPLADAPPPPNLVPAETRPSLPPITPILR